MKNPDIFNSFDMVVSIKQKTINDQIAQLQQQGVVHTDLTIVQDQDANNNFIFKVLNPGESVQQDLAFISGRIVPQISIVQSGSNLVFVIAFAAGRATLWTGEGPTAKLKSFDLAGWKYGISVNLTLAGTNVNDFSTNVKTSDAVKNQIQSYLSNRLSISRLFMDFQSANLMTPDPATTVTPTTDNRARSHFIEFMSEYFKWIGKTGNPFVLGYSVQASDATPPNPNIPASLQPSSTTFTVFKDPNNADFSNVNFVLATKGGHKNVGGTPGNLESNWFAPNEDFNAKVIYSRSVLVEQFILRPIFDKIRDGFFAQVSKNINVGPGNTFDAAISRPSPYAWNFAISNVASGDDQYQNNFNVAVHNLGPMLQFTFSGNVSVYKEVSKNMFFCTARAWARGAISWTGTVTIQSVVDGQGNPSLAVQNQFQTNPPQVNKDTNSCSDAFSWMGRIIGSILDVFTFFQDGSFFGNLFADLFSVSSPGVANLSVALGDVSNSIRSSILMPTGQVFVSQNPASDPVGNFSLDLNYKR